MHNSRIIELMARKMGKIAHPEELEELDRLLREQPGYGYLQEVVHGLKGNEDHRELTTPKEELTSHGWKGLVVRLSEEEAAPSTGRILSLRWLAAASVLVVLAITGVILQRKMGGGVAKAVMPKMITATAGYGKTNNLILPDGTKVWLNAGSRLVYPVVFSGSSREVELVGEAYFDVARDVKAPFSVHAGKVRIGVLGTVFDVKAYYDDRNIETTLISGKVQVTMDNDPDKPILLSPHEKLTIASDPEEESFKQNGKAKKAPAKALNALRYQVQSLPTDSGDHFRETAWLSNKLVFSNESFESVAHKLERKYDVVIRFEDQGLMDEYISGVFEKEAIDQVLTILQMTTGVHYRIDGRTVFISSKRSSFKPNI